MKKQSRLISLLHKVSYCVFIILSGCSIYSNSLGDFYYEPPRESRILNVSNEEMKPSPNFHNNTGIDRAYFGISTADCFDGNGARGIFVISLNNSSVAKRKGLIVGDKILQLGVHKPYSTKNLTYIIQRVTPDTVQSIIFERNFKSYEVIVIPPSWMPTEKQREKADSPYQLDKYPCKDIGLIDVK
jgi:hypothetical protein